MIFAFAGTSGQVASDSADDFLTISAFGEPALGICDILSRQEFCFTKFLRVLFAFSRIRAGSTVSNWDAQSKRFSQIIQFIPFSNWSFVSLTARAVWGKNRSGV